MTKLYRKSEITFAVIWIVAYVVLSSMADRFSESIGVTKSATFALHLAMTVILYVWIRKNGLEKKYGFCSPELPASKFLYYLPLALIASMPLWSGVTLAYGLPGSLFYFLSMCCVGFLEEVIFRGLLFRAMEKDGIKSAIIVSSLTFGIGHIVNLFNGSGKDLAGTMVLILFAVLVGFVLVMIFYRGGSLVPCVIFHSVNNSLSAFSGESTMDPKTAMLVNIGLIIVVLGGYSAYLYNSLSMKEVLQ